MYWREIFYSGKSTHLEARGTLVCYTKVKDAGGKRELSVPLVHDDGGGPG